MPSKSEVDPGFAFQLYVRMGEKRSMSGLEAKLKELGHPIGRATLMRWRDKFNWNDKVQEGDELAIQAKSAAMAAHQLAEQVQEDPDVEIPFTMIETFEGTANQIHAMTASISQVVTNLMVRTLKRNAAVSIDEALAMARVTVDLGRTAASMQQVIQGVTPGKGKAAERNPETGLLEGAVLPGQPIGGPPGVMEMIEFLSNPPRTR